MKDKEKKVKATEEETKKELQTEEQDAKLTDEELEQVFGGGPSVSPPAIEELELSSNASLTTSLR